MLCDICKANEATVHLTQIIGGKVKNVKLCEACSKEKGVQDPAGFSIADMLLGLGATEEMESKDKEGNLHCHGCGFTLEDFKKTGRLGCDQCYQTFAEGLQSVLKAMHKGDRHVGKIPAALLQNIEKAKRLSQLKKQLEEAVKKENYELAATLRDQIHNLQKQ